MTNPLRFFKKFLSNVCFSVKLAVLFQKYTTKYLQKDNEDPRAFLGFSSTS